MMDELRDYRYYAEDLVHPSPLAVKYIFENKDTPQFRSVDINGELYEEEF